MTLILIVIVAGFGNLDRPLLWRPPAGSTNYYFDPYPPDETLPLTLRNNDYACWGCCCLFPIAGGIIGSSVLKEKPAETKEKYLSFRLTYSIGSVYGKRAWAPSPGAPLTKDLYWVNQIGLNLGYSGGSAWEIDGGLSYMWGRETDKETPFYLKEEGPNYGWLGIGSWDISSFTPSLSIKFLKRGNKYLKIGLEWYFARGFCYEVPAYVTTKGMAPGVFIGAGFNPKLNSNFGLDLAVLGRLGLVWNPDYRSDEPIERDEFYYHSFTGLYLTVGIRYLTPLRGAK